MPYEESAWRSLHDVVGVILAGSNPAPRDGGRSLSPSENEK
jgi:hypothetical protein